MPNYNITLTGAPLNVNAHWTVEQFHQASLQSISGTISSSNLILGKVGGTIPTADVGPWLDGLIWKAWFPQRTVADGVTNTTTTVTSATINFTASDIGKTVTGTDIPAITRINSVTNSTTAILNNAATGTHTGNTFTIVGDSYKSVVPTIGSNGLYVSFVASLEGGNRLVTVQDKDGTVALTSDVYVPRATVFPTMQVDPLTTTIDWSLGTTFGLPLTSDISIVNTNSTSGQVIQIMAYNAALAVWLVKWGSSGVKWDGGVAPTASTNDKADVFILRNIGGQIYGQKLQAYA